MAPSARPRMDYTAPSVYEELIAPRYAPVADELVAAAGVLAGDCVLELGAGTGLVTRRVAPLVEPGGLIVASDRSAAMLGVAREVTVSAAAVFLELDYSERLPFLDGSFDVVLSGLTYAQDDDESVAEVQRALRPGGRLALTMWGEEYREPRMMSAAKQDLGDPAISPPQPSVVVRRLEGVGFEAVERRDFELEPVYASVDDYLAYRRGFGVPVGSTPERHEQYLAGLGRLAEAASDADGKFTQGWAFSLITAPRPRYP